ncbi:putative ribonuclease H-like domain-containing protein [Tanacetum coccineum]
MRARNFYQRTGRKIIIDGSNTAGYDKSKVECFNCHKWDILPENAEHQGVKTTEIGIKMVLDLIGVTWQRKEIQAKHGSHGILDSETDSSSVKSPLVVDKDWKEKFFCPANQVREKEPKKSRENNDAPIIEDWVSDDEDEFEPNLRLKRKLLYLLALKKGLLKPEHQLGGQLGYADMYRQNVNTVRARGFNAVKTSACWVWKPIKPNGASLVFNKYNYIDARGRSKIVDRGCSRATLSGNIAHLLDFKDFDRGYVTFGRGANGGRITGKVADENQYLLKIPTQDNMYTFDMKNIVPKDGLTCLVAKATSEESMLWHKRLGHVNFKNINKLVKENLANDSNTGSRLVSTAVPEVNTATSEDLVGPSPASEDSHVEDLEIELENIPQSYEVPKTPQTRQRYKKSFLQALRDPGMGRAMQEVNFFSSNCKVKAFIMASDQAPRAWYDTLANYLLCNGFERGKIDQTLFIKRHKGHILLVQIYVDDIIFGSTKKELCDEFEKLMKDKFQMSSMGELTFFLGLQVQQKRKGIFISQDKYVHEILRKFNYSDVKSASTPTDLEKPLVQDGDAADVDEHLYRSMIGSLMYLTASRPDIMFAVYLKGKPSLGLWYSKDSPLELVAYTDSDYAGATLDRKSTTGAEYVAAASCCGQVLWIQNQLLDYGYNFIDTVIYIDNTSTICIIENPVQHSKTKHIEIRHHFIRDCNAKKLIQMAKIDTQHNVADLLTKGFDAGRFQYLVSSIGMLNP